MVKEQLYPLFSSFPIILQKRVGRNNQKQQRNLRLHLIAHLIRKQIKEVAPTHRMYYTYHNAAFPIYKQRNPKS